MSFSLGSISIGEMYVGSTKIAEAYLGSTKVFGSSVDPYNPLGLPQYTIRARFASAPAATANGGFSGVITHVSDDIYDIQTSNWVKLFGASIFFDYAQIDQKPVEVLGANSTGVTSMAYTFYDCSFSTIPLIDTSSVTSMQYMFYNNTSLASVPLFDTSSVTDMKYMFYYNTSLANAPLFDTSNVTEFTNMFTYCTSLTSVPQYTMTSATKTDSMFSYCTNVSSGALSLYNSVSQQTNPPSVFAGMFRDCGANTTNGLAELNQIPGNWGGRYGRITCGKYYYSSANTDLAAFSQRASTGYLAGTIWVPDRSYVSSVVYSIKTPTTASTMRVYPASYFFKWNTSQRQTSATAVKFGAFAIPKADLSRQQVYSSYYGWKSSSEPQFLYQIANAATAPTSSYKTYTPPANATYNITSNYPSLPANWAILLCLYIYTNNIYYFGTVAQPSYGYIPYSTNDLIVQVSDATVHYVST